MDIFNPHTETRHHLTNEISSSFLKLDKGGGELTQHDVVRISIPNRENIKTYDIIYHV